MDAASALQHKIRSTIPLSEAMQFEINALNLESISVSAPLQPNVNIHGTGFAGSIYSLAVLTGWALCTHILAELEIDAELVVAKGEIRYRAPVTGDFECHCMTTEAQRDEFVQGVETHGKGILNLEIQVGSQPAAVLQATYAALDPTKRPSIKS